MTLWLLGDQLYPEAAPLQRHDSVLLVEAHEFADRLAYHPQKLTLLFAAMRHARDDLRDRGVDVTYLRAATFGDALDDYFAANPGASLTVMRPSSHGAADRLRELVESRGGSLSVVASDLFVTTPAEWDRWTDGRGDGYRQEQWYRHVRRETGVLMDGDDPVGGDWNYDEQNRETPPDDWDAPPLPTFEPDDLTREVHAFVTERYGDHWGDADLDGFPWPVTRSEALAALDQFVETRLPAFGPYQDAMLQGEWALAHSLLSPALNLGLLHPREVVDAATAAYRDGDADVPLQSVEGFVRQLLGWREFMRHAYREAMPGLADANQLGQERDLPPLYWTGDTDMACLSAAVGHVRRRGYAHHIERLMVLSNFALLYGVDPAALNRWFHLGFVDAFHWVTTPNVVGMGSFGTDLVSSKPYAASANYVNRMSDHCASCPYDPDETTGEDACPFNSLYWDFLREHEETLRGTGRMGLVYHHVDDKDDAEWRAIRDRAADVRADAANGDL
ncbi:cryptochrome/photolyase family protein [Halobaculum sp. D14]|uniref:cryptochrome/photolyase family protein n=1 Tax=Halobaculum sp. D14 TaxID=3421642 RepID=UPI003EB96B89